MKKRSYAYRAVVWAGLSLGLVALAPVASANGFPDRPIRMIVPFAAGGGTDVLGRLLAQKMSEDLKQPVIVENKPGAGGSVGTADVARATPDGYTILLGSSSTHGINPVLYSTLQYDPIKDFAPIGLIATNVFAMAVPAASPAKNVADFIAMTKNSPGKYDYASSGNGTTSHLAGALFVHQAGLPLTHIPYKSNVPGLNDLIANRVAVMFDNITAMQGQLQGGTIRVLATTGNARSPILPDVPTMQEQGLKDYYIGGWFCLLAPDGTPAAAVTRLQTSLERVLQMPDVRERMTTLGADPKSSTPSELQALIASEIPRWKAIVQTAGAKVE